MRLLAIRKVHHVCSVLLGVCCCCRKKRSDDDDEPRTAQERIELAQPESLLGEERRQSRTESWREKMKARYGIGGGN
jgi:hypothetical protein